METYDQNIIIEQIVAFLDGRASNDEALSLHAWVAQSEEHQAFFVRIRNVYEMSGRQLDPSVINADKALQKVLRRISPHRKTFRLGVWLQRAAAVLFIPLLATSLFYQTQHRKSSIDTGTAVSYYEMRVATGARSFFTLPDSTRVWLNSGSKIRYPNHFIGTERTVFIEGEAYLEVTSSKEHPFVVNTPTIQLRATGTKFHVADFANNPVKEVSLLSGKVALGKIDADNNPTHLLDINPGQHVKYVVTDQTTSVTDGEQQDLNPTVQKKQDLPDQTASITEGDLYKYYAWKDNKMVFRNDLMTDVVKRISQLFGVEIELQGEELKTYLYRATFEDESLNEILKLLKLTAPINYREIKRKQQADGTFTPPKIVIYPLK